MPKYIKETNEFIVSKGDYLRFGMKFYKYIGKVKTSSEAPETDCLYSIDDLLYIRRVDYNRLQMLKNIDKPVKAEDNSDELNLEVKPGDDSTLIIIKELLKGFTKNTFRKLFDNDSDMNNMRRAIEKSPNGQLSLSRFRTILNKLGLKYKIVVYEDENTSSSKFNACLESKVKDINERVEQEDFDDTASDKSDSDDEDMDEEE